MEDLNVKRTKSNLLRSIKFRLKALLSSKRDLTRRRLAVSTQPDTTQVMEQETQEQPRHVLGFMDLPFEIRSQIFGENNRTPSPSLTRTDGPDADLAIGHRTIHIDRRGFYGEGVEVEPTQQNNTHEPGLELTHWTCSANVSDEFVFQWHSQPVDPSKVVENWLWDDYEYGVYYGAEPEWARRPHGRCRRAWGSRNYEAKLNLRWLLVSKQFRQEASEILYRNCKFDLERASDITLWLSAVPADLRPHIRHVGLKVAFDVNPLAPNVSALTFNASVLTPSTWIPEWSKFFVHVMPKQLVGLKSLDLAIISDSFASFWSIQAAASFRSVFLPLRSLKNLTKFWVVIDQTFSIPCLGDFLEAREFERKIADDIMQMVLRKEGNDGTGDGLPPSVGQDRTSVEHSPPGELSAVFEPGVSIFN